MYMGKEILNVEMKIYLDSDLISGSGESWGNRVDTDVTYDQYGFPYIPARRIRGLLKEAAWELEQFQVLPKGTAQLIFGNEEKQGHYFILHNAELKQLHSMKNELDHLKKEYEEFISPFSVLEHYTTIRYQTAIEPDGIAKENSLRSSRAIAKGNVFYSHMECEKEDFDILQKCAAMIHHMGINRTRGFGEVTISLKEMVSSQSTTQIQLDDDKEYILDICMRNNSSLSIGLTQSSETLDYIPGSSLLGYFANQYLKNNKLDQTFYDMFVLGKLQFSNAYISDEYWNEYIPIKQSIYKQKVGNTYFDKSIEDNENEILSKVRNKYMSLKGHQTLIKDVNKEMVYHHRRPEDKSIGHVVSNDDIKNGMFYQLEVISENQCFIGHIRGQGKYLKEILEYISGTIQIGKSKSTQYGNIIIENIEYHELTTHIYKAGEEVILTLVSPLLLLDNKKESILDLQYLAEIFELDQPQFYVDYTKIGGYNAKWQLQKPTYVAFAQGSCIKGVLKKDMPQHIIKGVLIQEGLGIINIESIEEVRKRNIKKYASKQQTGNKIPDLTKDIILTGVKNKLHLDALQMINKITIPTVITKTLIGKMLKMADSSWEQFVLDAKGIADDKKKKGVMQFIKEIEKICNQLMKESLLSEDDSYAHEFYLQTLKDYLVHEKLERRDV